jgi:hypothetical protein
VRIALCAVLVALMFRCATAVEFDLTPSRIQAAIALAREPDSARAAFHAPYVLSGNTPVIDHIEIVTEFRRIVTLCEARIADGDPLFTHNLVAVQNAMRPFKNRVSIVAHLRFHPQNAYVVAPNVDVLMLNQLTPVSRLDMRTDTQFGFGSGKSGERLPVFGATAEAVYDAADVGQTYRTIVVRIDDKDVARMTVDLARIQ